MIKEAQAVGFYPILEKRETVDSLIQTCRLNFASNLLRVYDRQFNLLSEFDQKSFYNAEEVVQKESKDSDGPISISSILPHYICSIHNYSMFFDKTKARFIKFNSKDIKYNELVLSGDLWEFFKHYHMNYEDQLQESINKSTHYDEPAEYIKSYPIENYHYFFGAGEFPCLDFNIVRIGNVDYSFYTIVR